MRSHVPESSHALVTAAITATGSRKGGNHFPGPPDASTFSNSTPRRAPSEVGSAFLLLRSGLASTHVSLRMYRRIGSRRPAFGARRRYRGGYCSNLMRKRDVTCRALIRVNPLFIIYRSSASDGRGPGGDKPRPEQPQLKQTSTAESALCCGSARRTCAGKAGRQQGARHGSS
jgi:hypothetical protein